MPAGVARLLRRTHAAAPLLWSLWAAAPVIDRVSPLATSAGRALLQRRLFSAPDADPADVQAAVQDFVRTPLSVLVTLAPSLLHYAHPDAVRRLRPLPVLVLAGTLDRTLPVAHSRRLMEHLHGCGELVLVEHAGHMVNVMRPHEVSQACSGCWTPRGLTTCAEQRRGRGRSAAPPDPAEVGARRGRCSTGQWR